MICNLWGSKEADTWRQREDRILLEQGVRTLIRHGYPRFIRLALRIISSGFDHRDACGTGGVVVRDLNSIPANGAQSLVASVQDFAVPRADSQPPHSTGS